MAGAYPPQKKDMINDTMTEDELASYMKKLAMFDIARFCELAGRWGGLIQEHIQLLPPSTQPGVIKYYRDILTRLSTITPSSAPQDARSVALSLYYTLGTASDSQRAISGRNSELRNKLNGARAQMVREKFI